MQFLKQMSILQANEFLLVISILINKMFANPLSKLFFPQKLARIEFLMKMNI